LRELSHEEKAERIEQLVSSLIKSVNNAAIIDDYFDVVLNIQRLISTKLNDRVRLADARRLEYAGLEEKQNDDEQNVAELPEEEPQT
jgi:hypothetical protein